VPGRGDGKAKEDGRKGVTAGGREFVDMVVAYAKQETLGPLRGLGRFVAAGSVASIGFSLGGLLLLLALLRALQTETGSTFDGNLSWVPYLITAAAALLVLALSAWRIVKTPTAGTTGRSGGKDKS
jgi:dienelactone hydrolase